MRIEIDPTIAETDAAAWAPEKARRLLSALPRDLDIVNARISMAHAHATVISITHEGNPTLCTIELSKGLRDDEIDRKAQDYVEWYRSDGQQERFAEAHALPGTPVEVERMAAVIAATRVDGAAFTAGMRRLVASSLAKAGRKPNIAIGVPQVELTPGLILRQRSATTHFARIRTGRYRVTHLTFTPAVPTRLPMIMLEGVIGQPLERITDIDVFRGCGLVVAKAWNTHDAVTARTSFEVESDVLPLDEAAALIDDRRRRI